MGNFGERKEKEENWYDYVLYLKIKQINEKISKLIIKMTGRDLICVIFYFNIVKDF